MTPTGLNPGLLQPGYAQLQNWFRFGHAQARAGSARAFIEVFREGSADALWMRPSVMSASRISAQLKT